MLLDSECRAGDRWGRPSGLSTPSDSSCGYITAFVRPSSQPATARKSAGLLLAFPAIFPAGATLIEKDEKEKKEKKGLHGTVRGKLRCEH
jgi:hypothetical protein